MFRFFVSDDIVTLLFQNDNIEIRCCPETPDGLNSNSYVADTVDGFFDFSFDDKKIRFSAARYDRGGEGGSLSIYVKMTPEIKKSLDDALNEWREYLKEREKDDSDSDYESE